MHRESKPTAGVKGRIPEVCGLAGKMPGELYSSWIDRMEQICVRLGENPNQLVTECMAIRRTVPGVGSGVRIIMQMRIPKNGAQIVIRMAETQ